MRAWLIAVAFAMVGLLVESDARAQSARSVAEILADADAAFDQGVQSRTLLLQARRHFARAADRYLELHERGIRNPALYRSLGNAAALADRPSEAIWAYHLSLRLDPNFAGLREQLDFVRRQVIYPPAGQGRREADTWPEWLHRPTLYELFFISIIAYIAMCALGVASLLRHSRTAVILALAFLVISLIAGIGAWHEWRLAEFEREAPLVIVAENTPLFRGNARSYPHHPSLALLYRGMEVRQLHRRGDWVQVRLTTGEIGWLPLASVLIVEP